MKIIIDAMGGDNAPLEIVKGALLGMEHWGVEVLLTGDTEAILRALRDCGHDTIPHGMEIVHTTETVDMCDDPSKVFRHKKDTSMGVGLTLLRDGKADALVSAGSTGALLAGATLITKRIRGIRRAAMAPVIPTTGGRAVLIDCGANAECTPEYLLQFAYLGSFYAGRVLGLERPRVGLLNIGTEDSKGTDLQKAALALLRQAGADGHLNFIGNIEVFPNFSLKRKISHFRRIWSFRNDMIYPIRLVRSPPFATPRAYTKELLLLFRKSSPESCLY